MSNPLLLSLCAFFFFNSILQAADIDLNSPACQKFQEIGFKKWSTESMKSDQIVVHKDGKTVFTHYLKDSDENVLFGPKHPHILWSASKSITAFAVAALVKQQADQKVTNPFSFSTKISDIIPFSEKLEAMERENNRRRLENTNAGADHKLIEWDPKKEEENYKKITIQHLVSMTSGISWAEGYSSIAESSFLTVLYGYHRNHILEGALIAPMEDEPGKFFNYSGGNAIMLMEAIARVTKTSAPQALKQLLFEPLGLENAFFETDKKGLPVASSYAYMGIHDYLKVGLQLMNELNKTAGKNIWPKEFVAKLNQPNRDLKNSSIEPGSEKADIIVANGHFSDAAMWINKPVVNKKGSTIHKQDFPNAPTDAFLTAGHFGQNIIVFPSQNMVIARTGQNDGEGYWDKLDAFMASAVSCFDNKPLPLAISQPKPAPSQDEEEKTSLGLWEKLSFVIESLKSGLGVKSFAKDYCSCVYVTKIGPKGWSDEKRLEQCLENMPTDAPRFVRNNLFQASVDADTKTVTTSLPRFDSASFAQLMQSLKIYGRTLNIPAEKVTALLAKLYVALGPKAAPDRSSPPIGPEYSQKILDEMIFGKKQDPPPIPSGPEGSQMTLNKILSSQGIDLDLSSIPRSAKAKFENNGTALGCMIQ